ncbi:MAG: hypothetical protein H0T44_11855 [Gemmatimonadales bacterium]|nr:hypothetical protein [Gemmatimonadales bacterium]
MRVLHLLGTSLLFAASAVAQAPERSGGWRLSLGADALRFAGVARDTSAPPQAQASLRPNGRLGLHMALARSFGLWGAELEVGWAGGHASATNRVVAIEDKTAELSRIRVAPALSRRLMGVGNGEIALALGPTFDLWLVDGAQRSRVGAEARVALRVPVGSVELENRITAGLSSSPVIREDLQEGFALSGLRALAFGTGLRIRL